MTENLSSEVTNNSGARNFEEKKKLVRNIIQHYWKLKLGKKMYRFCQWFRWNFKALK